MMAAVGTLFEVIAYVAIGGLCAGYAEMRHHKHSVGCGNCGWQLLGIIWPLYLAWAVGLNVIWRLVAVGPYRFALRLGAARKEARKLPQARTVVR